MNGSFLTYLYKKRLAQVIEDLLIRLSVVNALQHQNAMHLVVDHTLNRNAHRIFSAARKAWQHDHCQNDVLIILGRRHVIAVTVAAYGAQQVEEKQPGLLIGGVSI